MNWLNSSKKYIGERFNQLTQTLKISSLEKELIRLRGVSGKETFMMMLCALLIGLGCGLLAVGLNGGVHFLKHFFQTQPQHIWLIGIPAVGAGLGVFIMKSVLKDLDSHGVPSVIKSVSLGKGDLKARMIVSRFLGSLLTVGGGGSAGLEGPILCIGGAWGALLGRWLKMNERQKKLLISYGVAGAISGIFNAPITGLIFTLEILLREWSYLTILPAIISATAATELSRFIMGNKITFHFEIASFSTTSLVASIGLGILTSLVSSAFSRSLVFWEELFKKVSRYFWLRSAIGGLAVGILGYFVPDILFEGYSVTQDFLSNPIGPTLGVVLLFTCMKFIACGITLGSGGVGGVFAPSLILGSAVGMCFGLLLHLFPLTNLASDASFALIGMAGMVTGVMHGPLTGIFLVMEITRGYSLILPLMIIASTSMLMSFFLEEGSVYTRELIREGHLVKRGSDAYVLHYLNLREILDRDFTTVPEGLLLGDFVQYFKRSRRNYFPVLDDTGNYLGVVLLDDIRPYLFNYNVYDLVTMGSIMKMWPMIECDLSIDEVLKKFEKIGSWSLPVVENGKYLGMLSKSTLFDHYRREVQISADV
ncbi:MAG: chloride channel protein [SAR324 cluster bacterium]|nr:chloride channel protein [SAR324 cluster bacterium]